MKTFLTLILLLIADQSFAMVYHVGDTATYKYNTVFEGDADYRFEKLTVVQVKDDGRAALVTSVESIGMNGPVTYKYQYWNYITDPASSVCKSSMMPLTVAAGTFNVCLDMVGKDGAGLYFSFESKWLFIRTRVESCTSLGSVENCFTYNKDLVSVSP